MIGYVRGTITHLYDDLCYVDVHGVGYRVYIPISTRERLITGSEATLYTYTNVREDAIHLYGFFTEEEYELFSLLISVSGIGPKAGLGILSGIRPTDFVRAICNESTDQLIKLPGIGKKSAERLVLELKDKIKKLAIATEGATVPSIPIIKTENTVANQAIEALVSLGYTVAEVEPVVEECDDGQHDVATLIKISLAILGKGR